MTAPAAVPAARPAPRPAPSIDASGRASGFAMFRTGLAALRGNPLRSILSALGVVIGVGAMVTVLALSDGVESAIRERLAFDGRLLTLRIVPQRGDFVDGTWVPRGAARPLTPADARSLAAALAAAAPRGATPPAVNLTVAQGTLATARRPAALGVADAMGLAGGALAGAMLEGVPPALADRAEAATARAAAQPGRAAGGGLPPGMPAMAGLPGVPMSALPTLPAAGDSTADSAAARVHLRGVSLRGAVTLPSVWRRKGLLAGRWPVDSAPLRGAAPATAAADTARVLVASHALAVRLLADLGERVDTSGQPEPKAAALVGRTVWLAGAEWRVVGVARPDAADSLLRVRADRRARGDTADGTRVRSRRGVPLGALAPVAAALTAALPLPGAPTATPELEIAAEKVEGLPAARAAAEQWLAGAYGAQWRDAVELVSYESEGKEVARVMLIFRLLMGAITGISLVVGGVGIMNVLLASVTERTREIGISKAVGARARDIRRQYLAESVAIASTGAVLGGTLGLVVAHTIALVMRRMSDIPVQAGLSLSTVLVALGAPAIVGLTFGLYPALRAARLSPIDAIRHE